jgi:DNA-binding transcriptional LysR family regulator
MSKSGLAELNAVIAVSTHRSFRRAAIELGMSPSGLSHAVAALEQRLGVKLFHRTTRSVSLSEAGEQFLARVSPALREISDAIEAVNDFRDTPAGTLRLNSSARAAQLVLMPLVLEFLDRYPQMRIDLVTEGRLVDIVADGFDAGIRSSEAVPQDMVAVPVGPDISFAVIGSLAYFTAHPRPLVPGDLANHECIRSRLPSGTLYRWEFEKRGEELVVDVPGRLTLDDHDLMLQAALAGSGLVYTSEWSVRAHIASGSFIRVLEDWTPAYPGLSLYYPRHRHLPAGLRAFVALIREKNVRGRDVAS